jgi:hypothetical protein
MVEGKASKASLPTQKIFVAKATKNIMTEIAMIPNSGLLGSIMIPSFK